MTPHRIAIVDDAPEVRALLRARLRVGGAFTVVAEGGTGEDAIRIAREEQPDLLLLDVSMPGLGGLDAVGPVREVSPGTKVVMFSGFSEEGLEDRALGLGAAAFIEKSAPIEDVVAALLEIAAGVSPTAASLSSTAPSSSRPGAPVDARGLSAGTPDAEDEWILAEHVERFRAVFDQAAIGMGTLTLTGQIVRANPALAALLREERTELVGVPLLDVVPGADRDLVGFALTTAVREGVAHVEHRLAGTDRVVTSTIAAVRDSARRPLYLLLQSQDVSAQRSTERALLESEERFRLLVDSVADYAIFMLDREGRIASWNLGAERLKGYRADEVLGQHFRLFYTQDAKDSRHPEHELEAAVRDGRYQEEGWRLRKDGTLFWANVVITALRDADGQTIGFAKVTRDVTKQRRASQNLADAAHELAEANEDLSQANVRLGAAARERANLLAITAHELRSPLAVVAGAATLLGRHWAALEDGERDELLVSVQTSADQMRRMLDELLLAARLEAGRVDLDVTTVPLRPVLEAAVAQHGGALAETAVAIDCPPGLEVTTDVVQLGQVLVNYLANAARYGAEPITLRASSEGAELRVVVEDAGPGVPEPLSHRLFEEMFLKGASTRGTGLGLYIVRRVARSLGGDAWYERADGATRFGVSLPVGGPPA
ncbi:PAS domain S-box protein [Georgenia sp. MJ206]|uniref:PAS domain S-box protein n=1 Tax=Georgenia wangjunii TaxID=3117730 RepID=UPI002F2660A6